MQLSAVIAGLVCADALKAQGCAATLDVTGPVAGVIHILETQTACGGVNNATSIYRLSDNYEMLGPYPFRICNPDDWPDRVCRYDSAFDTCDWIPGAYKVNFYAGCSHPQEGGGCIVDGPDATLTKTFTVESLPAPPLTAIYRQQTNDVLLSWDSATSRITSVTVQVDNGPEEGINNCYGGASNSCIIQRSFDCGTVNHRLHFRGYGCWGQVSEADAMIPASPCPYTPTSCTECDSTDHGVANRTGPSGPNPTSCKSCVVNPIAVTTGEATATINLFTIPQPAGSLEMALTYHSLQPTNPVPVPLSTGWTHTFNMNLRKVGWDGLQLETSEGAQAFFTSTGSTEWVSTFPPAARDRITVNGSQYVLQYLRGGESRFDVTTGHWLSTVDRWGNTISGTYDSNGRLSVITNGTGNQYTFSYDSATGRLIQIALPGSSAWVWRFTYDSYGFLAAVFDPLHTSTTPWRSLTYSNDHLYQILDDAGQVLEQFRHYVYWPYQASEYSSGGVDNHNFYLDYPSAGQVTVNRFRQGWSYPLPTVYTRSFVNGSWVVNSIAGPCDSCGDTSISRSFTYDNRNRLKTQTNATGHVTQYDYDAAGNLTTRTEAVGTPKQRVTSYEYSNPAMSGVPTKITVAGGQSMLVTQHDWSADERTLTITRTGLTPPNLGAPTSYVETDTFDARHRLLSHDGPRADVTDVTTYTYYPDDDADTFRRGRLHTVTNAMNHTTTYDDYDIFGTARSITDANGATTHLQTDARGRVTATTNSAVSSDPNESADYTATTTYDTRDRMVSTVSPGGRRTDYSYRDGTNWLLDTTRRDFAGNEVERRHLTRSDLGLLAVEELQSCSNPAPTCTTWVTKWSRTNVFDINLRIVEVDDPEPAGSRTIYSYDADGKLTAVQDQNHTTANTTYGYDELDRLLSVTQKSGPTSNIVTSYSYDPGDNLTSVTDPNGNTTQYVYDDFGLLVTQTSPVTGTTTYVYDAAGNLRTSTDANGTITNRTYDPLNRVLSSTSACTGDDTEVVTWSYDTGLPVDYSKGRLVGMDDPSGSTSYKYDRRGLVRLEEHVVSDPVLGVSDFSTPMSYDSDGNRTAIADVRYTYDFAARPATAAIVCSGCTTTTVVSSVSYLPFGPELTLQFGNGMHQSRQFDLRYREKQNLLTSGASVTVARYDYSLDAVGNITDMLDGVDHTFDRHYSYDDLSRLVGSTTGTSLWGSAGFSYDAMGNLTVINSGTPRVQSFSFTGATPKIASPPTTYDDVGNERVSDFMWSPGGSSTITRSYSCRNLMSKATISATSVPDENYTYTYDGRGVRVSGTSGSASGEQYVYSTELQLLRRRVIPSSGDDEFVWFNGRPVAQVTLSGQSGYSRLAYTLTDHLGSPLLQTDAAGNIIWRAEYEPYGRIYQMRTGVSAQQPLRLPGQEAALHGHDVESYNIFRWYRAGWGRYTQADPIGFDGSDLNLYRYAADNPLRNVDLLGLDFTNNSSKSVCIIKDNLWSTVASGVTIRGDVDGVAAPKGQQWGTPPRTSRVYKWIDCFHASIRDVPGKSPFIGIQLIGKSSDEIDALPFRRRCLCKALPGMSQSLKGGPTSDFGDPPASCP